MPAQSHKCSIFCNLQHGTKILLWEPVKETMTSEKDEFQTSEKNRSVSFGPSVLRRFVKSALTARLISCLHFETQRVQSCHSILVPLPKSRIGFVQDGVSCR